MLQASRRWRWPRERLLHQPIHQGQDRGRGPPGVNAGKSTVEPARSRVPDRIEKRAPQPSASSFTDEAPSNPGRPRTVRADPARPPRPAARRPPRRPETDAPRRGAPCARATAPTSRNVPRLPQQPLGRRMYPPGSRKDPMVHVQHRPAVLVSHGRQLVHPFTVVALVVQAPAARSPSRAAAARIALANLGLRHQDVHVGDDAADAAGQPGGDIRSALEEHGPDASGQQRSMNAVDLPFHRPFELATADARRGQATTGPVLEGRPSTPAAPRPPPGAQEPRFLSGRDEHPIPPGSGRPSG